MPKAIIIDEIPAFEIAVKNMFIDAAVSLDIVGYADNGIDGMALLRTLHPDFLIIDSDIKFINTIEIIKRAKCINKKIKVVIFGVLKSDHLKNQFLCCGADLCIDKRSSVEECIKKFKFAHSSTFSSSHLLKGNAPPIASIKKPYSLSSLSYRETLVLKHLALGEKIHDIAKRYNLSPKTISTYKYIIAKKLDIQTIFEFRDFAKKCKII